MESLRQESKVLAKSKESLIEIRDHLDSARWLVGGPLTESFSLVAASAHLRLAIEKISLVSFIGHELLTEEDFEATGARKMAEAFKRMKAVNPDFWPRPIVLQKKEGMGLPRKLRFVYLKGGVTEEEASKMWGELSANLHAYSKARKGASDREKLINVARTGEEIQGLLQMFVISNSATDMTLIGSLKGDDVGMSWIKFGRLSPEGGDVIGYVDDVLHSTD